MTKNKSNKHTNKNKGNNGVNQWNAAGMAMLADIDTRFDISAEERRIFIDSICNAKSEADVVKAGAVLELTTQGYNPDGTDSAEYAEGIRQEMRRNEEERKLYDDSYSAIAERALDKLDGGVGLSEYEKLAIESASLWEEDGSPVPKERREARKVELLDKLAGQKAASKVGPPTKENANPDIKPVNPIDQYLKQLTDMVGNFKMPEMSPLADGTVPDSPFKEIGKMLHRSSDSAKRTSIFERLCKDKDLEKEANLLDKFKFFERYAPGLALDYDLVKDFMASNTQKLSIGSAIGLVQAEQVLVNAKTQRIVKGALLAGAGGCVGYLIGMALVSSLKKGG